MNENSNISAETDSKTLLCTPVFSDAVTHFSNVRRLPDGRLLTFALFGKYNTNSHPVSQMLMTRISEDEGKTWQFTGFLRELPDQIPRLYLGDFLIAASGRIHLFLYRIWNIDFGDAKKLKGDIIYVRMDDEMGKNMVYRKIEALDRYTGSMNNFIQLPGGRLIAPFSTIADGKGSIFVSGILYSDDDGDTWQASNDVSVFSDESNVESGAVEPVVVEAQPGVLVMLIRTVLNRLYYSVSYDGGAVWSEARPTHLSSSNAPCVPQRMPDGRIVLSWNNVQGFPMHGVRYSMARQCLHAAVSSDGLKTVRGIRIIVRKRSGDPDTVLNCYPFAEQANEQEVFISPFCLQDREKAEWVDPQRIVLRMNPDVLEADSVEDNFSEWISDCRRTEEGFLLHPTVDHTAYACVNFPYAGEGTVTLRTEGEVPASMRLLLSDCYIDRGTFLKNPVTEKYKDIIGKPYVELRPTVDGEWKICWDADRLTLTHEGGTQEVSLADWPHGFNHMMFLFEGETGSLRVTSFRMEAKQPFLNTGIEY